MLSKSVSFIILGALLMISVADALFFHLNLADRKCFIEEIPDETKVLVWLKVELYDTRTGGIMAPGHGLSMLVEARDPDNKLITAKEYTTEGRLAFTSHLPGEHAICMYSNTTKWLSESQLGRPSIKYPEICRNRDLNIKGIRFAFRVHFNIQTGEHTVDYITVAKKEKLTDLQLRVRQLLDQVDQITKEQNYQRYREERFRMTSESTNQRVLWWSLTQMVILLAMGAWQMKHLKSFFEAKKLV